MERKNAWKKYTEEEKAAVFAYGDEYRQFISDCKTERDRIKETCNSSRFSGYGSSDRKRNHVESR